MSAAALANAEARYQRAHTRAERARHARNHLIHTALGAGWTHARIAHATGLTRARVGQLALTGTMLDPIPQRRAGDARSAPRPPAQQEHP